MGPGRPVDSANIALIIDALRGGKESFEDHKEVAIKIREQVPGVRRMIAWSDRLASGTAERAVAGGIGNVIFGGAGIPAGGAPPHRAAAATSATARFAYPSGSEIVLCLRQLALEGDPRAVAFRASVLDPYQVTRRARAAGMAGPLQVQWGLASWLLSAGRGAVLAAWYAEVLPPGSQLVMLSAEHAAGVGALAGCEMHGHPPEVLAQWAETAGLDVVLEIPDARAWGRGDWPGKEFSRDWAAGQVSGLVAAVRPLSGRAGGRCAVR